MPLPQTLLLSAVLSISTSEPTPAKILVHLDQPGVSIPPDFVGLSTEKKMLSRDCFSAKNTTLINLCRNLGPGVLRIGGNEVDFTLWDRSEKGSLGSMQNNKYSTDTTTIGPASVDAAFDFARAANWRVIYGLNLGAGLPAMSADEADYALQVGREQLLALEIGNEPNLYSKGPNRPGIRPGSYGYPQYRDEFSASADAIVAKHPKAPITGPAVTKSTNWMPLFLADFKNRIVLSTSHVYPLSAKEEDPSSPRFPSPERLLTAKYDEDWLPKLEESKAVGIPFRIGECNTASSGGKKGVSDSFASALWSIDFMFDVARHGGAGVNLHGSFTPGNYAPIVFDKKTETYGPAPLYYGLLFFHEASQGRLLKTECRSEANLIAHSVLTPDGKLRVSLINKDLHLPILAEISVNPKFSKGTLLRLSAPNATSTSEVTFGGASVASDGTWSQKPGEPIPVASGKATIPLPAASAALLFLE